MKLRIKAILVLVFSLLFLTSVSEIGNCSELTRIESCKKLVTYAYYQGYYHQDCSKVVGQTVLAIKQLLREKSNFSRSDAKICANIVGIIESACSIGSIDKRLGKFTLPILLQAVDHFSGQ